MQLGGGRIVQTMTRRRAESNLGDTRRRRVMPQILHMVRLTGSIHQKGGRGGRQARTREGPIGAIDSKGRGSIGYTQTADYLPSPNDHPNHHPTDQGSPPPRPTKPVPGFLVPASWRSIPRLYDPYVHTHTHTHTLSISSSSPYGFPCVCFMVEPHQFHLQLELTLKSFHLIQDGAVYNFRTEIIGTKTRLMFITEFPIDRQMMRHCATKFFSK